jgi:hypothetical protein
MAIDIWGFSEAQVYGEADVKEAIDPRWGISPRTAMQKLGQAARDHMYPEIWISTAFEHVDDPKRIHVIEDVRYRNEAQQITSIGGYVWRLHCADSISTDEGAHPSEAEVDLIPSRHIAAELHSSRELGLGHLYGLADEQMKEIL